MAAPHFSITIRPSEIREMEFAFKRYGDRTVSATKAHLFQEAEGIMTVSKSSFVPVDTGALRSSGFVDRPKSFSDVITVDFGFGGAAAPYALEVHENLEAFHPVGTAKYLERPFRDAAPGIPKRLALRLRKIK